LLSETEESIHSSREAELAAGICPESEYGVFVRNRKYEQMSQWKYEQII